MLLEEFDYPLPPELIAQHPPARRDGGRLLRLDRRTGAVEHYHIMDLPDLLPVRSLLIVNDSRVIPARLMARRATGGRVEVLLIEKLESIDGAVKSEEKSSAKENRQSWNCMVNSSKPLRANELLKLEAKEGVSDVFPPQLTVLNSSQGGRCQIEIKGQLDFMAYGAMPLPPYIKRPEAAPDIERYQTIFACEEGSIAAPTAGLHFSPELLKNLQERPIDRRAVTLHVGPGTFIPVRTERVEDHRMEPERYWVSEETSQAIQEAQRTGQKIVAVGTTVMRTLEASQGRAGNGRTDLFIMPGYKFSIVDALLTNFHLPRSTLLMLVAAFAGREAVLAAYQQAIQAQYRFYSYGDAMLII